MGGEPREQGRFIGVGFSAEQHPSGDEMQDRARSDTSEEVENGRYSGLH